MWFVPLQYFGYESRYYSLAWGGGGNSDDGAMIFNHFCFFMDSSLLIAIFGHAFVEFLI